MADPFADELTADDDFGGLGDCGCGGSKLGASGELPSPQVLEAALDDFAAESASSGALSAELEFADEVLADDDVDLAALGDAQEVALDDVIALTERYPGLKVTLSFG